MWLKKGEKFLDISMVDSHWLRLRATHTEYVTMPSVSVVAHSHSPIPTPIPSPQCCMILCRIVCTTGLQFYRIPQIHPSVWHLPNCWRPAWQQIPLTFSSRDISPALHGFWTYPDRSFTDWRRKVKVYEGKILAQVVITRALFAQWERPPWARF